MTKTELRNLLEEHSPADSQTMEYSGRFMFGKTCPAISYDGSLSAIIADLSESIMNAGDNDLMLKFIVALRGAKTDSFGTGSILYFPEAK